MTAWQVSSETRVQLLQGQPRDGVVRDGSDEPGNRFCTRLGKQLARHAQRTEISPESAITSTSTYRELPIVGGSVPRVAQDKLAMILTQDTGKALEKGHS